MRPVKRPVDITIDTKRCLKCKKCLVICCESVYQWDAEQQCIRAAHPEDCEACFQCEMYCTGNCIEVKTITGPGQFFDAFYR